MKWIALAAAAACALAGPAARADEAGTRFGQIFADTCLAKFGHLDQVEDWVQQQQLPPISNPQALAVFAGRPNMDGKMRSFAGGGVPGSGRAWAVRDPAGRYVLATRLDPESCVLWAQQADPATVEAAFARMVADASKPGTKVDMVMDRTADVPIGKVHIRVYRLWAGSPMNSVALSMAAVSRAGGPFQAMLETTRVVEPDDVINPLVPLEPPPS